MACELPPEVFASPGSSGENGPRSIPIQSVLRIELNFKHSARRSWTKCGFEYFLSTSPTYVIRYFTTILIGAPSRYHFRNRFTLVHQVELFGTNEVTMLATLSDLAEYTAQLARDVPDSVRNCVEIRRPGAQKAKLPD